MEKYEVYENEPVMFHNRAFSCIGTGRMDLALHKEYLDQLALVQKKIGFDYIRGHGLLRTWQFIRNLLRRMVP